MKNNNHKTDCSKQTRVVPMKFRVVPIAGLGVILEVHGKSRPDQEADREYFLPMDIDAAMSMADMLRDGAIEASEKQATA